MRPPYLDKSEYSTSNGIHDEKDFDNEEIQNKMNNVINDIQVRSRNDTNTSRKSVTSNHLHDDQANNSTPTITNPLSNNSTESPLRSMSKTALVDHHVTNEQPSSSSIRQDESSSDANDIFRIKPAPTKIDIMKIHNHKLGRIGTNCVGRIVRDEMSCTEMSSHPLDNNDDFFNMKTRTINDDQRPASAINISYRIRCTNHEELKKNLRFLNQMVQKAGNLRIGKYKTIATNQCRVAIKENNVQLLIKSIKTGNV